MGAYAKREKLQIRVLDHKEERPHSHLDIELLYILEGTMDLEIENRKVHLGTDDIFVVNANKEHGFKASGDILFAQLLIEYQLVGDILNSLDIIFLCDSTLENHEKYDELKKLIRRLLNHYLSNRRGTGNFGHIALCYQIMDFLSVHFLVQKADRENWGEKEKQDERIRQIESYIHTNYNQAISMKELSEKLYLSNGYLSRFFKKTYGCTFAEYLTKIRLHYAVEELLYTDIPITRIAYDNGFANVTVFNKSFKKWQGESPSDMRRRAKKQNASAKQKEAEDLLDLRLDRYLKNGGAQEKKEDAVSICEEHSVKGCTQIKAKKIDTVNIGEAADLLRSEVQEHVMILKALGIKYVRFWSIFSKELLLDINGEQQEYNFSKLDSIIDFLLSQEMKPHMELATKPKRLMRNVQWSLVDARVEQVSIDPIRWEHLVKAMMHHLARRYGRDELDTWRMELWMDEGSLTQKGVEKDYFHLFCKLFEIVRQYSLKMEVGGCGITANVNKAAIKEFLCRWVRQKYQPDYVSAYFYAYQERNIDEEQYVKRDSDSEAFLRTVRMIRQAMDEAGMAGVRLYMTEWNHTISDRNYINDSCFMGAYIVKNVLEVYDTVDAMAFYQGSDRVSEYYDSGLLLYGGRGLLSKDGVMKPAAFAFEFFQNLYPYFVGRGKNYLVTTNGQESFGIICHNWKPLNYNYYLIPENEVRKDAIWKYYGDRETLELKLSLTDMTDGIYKIKMYQLDEANGSILDIWSDMGFEEELSRNDIKYLRRACEPRHTIQKYKVERGVMHLDIHMAPNQIMFIRIRRYV